MRIKFSEFLREERMKQEMSKYNLAKLTGLRITTISNYEAGKRVPSLDVADKLCKALNKKFTIGGE